MSAKENRLDKQFRLLEEKRKKLMQAIQSIPEEKYFAQPPSGGWSIAQTANHIFLSENLSLSYLKKKLSYPDTVPPFSITSWGGVLLIKFVFLTSYKVKAPKAINMRDEQVILAQGDLDQKWATLRADLIDFVKQQEPVMGSRLAYKHPFAGRMTMYQMLIFLNDHMAHHMRQIERIMENIK
jgi:uncharacterized damage-inducible protein DinB